MFFSLPIMVVHTRREATEDYLLLWGGGGGGAEALSPPPPPPPPLTIDNPPWLRAWYIPMHFDE